MVAVLVNSGCTQLGDFNVGECEPDYLFLQFTNEEMQSILLMGVDPSETCESKCYDERETRSFKVEKDDEGYFPTYQCYCDMNDCGGKTVTISENKSSKPVEKVTQETSELQFCARAQLIIQRAYYDSENNEITLAIFNTGDVPLTGIRTNITQINGETTTVEHKDMSISYQDIKTIKIRTSEDLKYIIVQSMQCEGAQDLIHRYDIQGFLV